MKKTYFTPTVVNSGNVVLSTKGPGNQSSDGAGGQIVFTPGTVGFNL